MPGQKEIVNNQKADENKAKLLQAPVGKTLISLAMPMAFGIMAIILFTVVDTFYIGQLGAETVGGDGVYLSHQLYCDEYRNGTERWHLLNHR